MTPAKRWGLAVGGLLIGNLVATGVLMGFAHGDTERRVVPDYYAKATHWDDTARAASASARLGWHDEVDLDARGVTVRLYDAAGHPLAGAKVSVDAHPQARLDVMLSPTLAEIAPGRYRAEAASTDAGMWNVAVHARQGDAIFGDDLVVERAP